MRPARRPRPARPVIEIEGDVRGVVVESVDAGRASAAGSPDGAGAAFAVKVADVACGADTRLYVPATVGVYAPVPVPFASTVTVNVLDEASGAVTWTVCVEWAVKPLRVTALGAPTVTEVAVIIGEPGGAAVEAAPQRSEADTPTAFTATIEKVCHADGLRPVAV